MGWARHLDDSVEDPFLVFAEPAPTTRSHPRDPIPEIQDPIPETRSGEYTLVELFTRPFGLGIDLMTETQDLIPETRIRSSSQNLRPPHLQILEI